jgi:hypothetical protein
MSRTALLIRTHFADDQLRALAERLTAEGAFDVFILADESNEPLDFGALPKVSLSGDTISELGLYDGLPSLFWRCGDYGLYAARRALPDYDGFWMIEPDARIRSERPSELLGRYPPCSQVDFLAGRLKPAEAEWDWAATMDASDGPIWRCLFAVVRLSAQAIDALYASRRRASLLHWARGRNPDHWPNDEAFVATTLARQGYAMGDLNDYGQVYDEAGYSFWLPISEHEFKASGRDGWLYHPVLSGQAYFIKLCRLAVQLGALDELELVVERQIGVEWTADEAKAHRRAIDFLRTQREIAMAPPPLAAE